MLRAGPAIPLIRASHIQPTLAVTAITTALACTAGRGAGSFWVASAVLAGQLSVGWSNDYIDRDRDALAGRTDKPIVAGAVDSATVAIAAVVAIILCVPLSLLSGWRAGFVHLGAVAAAWGYNAWLKRTLMSVLPYALAFGALPAFVTLGLDGSPLPPAWAVVAGVLLGTGAHFVNGLADRDADEKSGVRGLPQRLLPRSALLVGALSMGAATGVLAVAPPGNPGVTSGLLLVAAGVTTVAVVATALLGRERAAWSLTLCTALLAVAALVVQGDALV